MRGVDELNLDTTGIDTVKFTENRNAEGMANAKALFETYKKGGYLATTDHRKIMDYELVFLNGPFPQNFSYRIRKISNSGNEIPTTTGKNAELVGILNLSLYCTKKEYLKNFIDYVNSPGFFKADETAILKTLQYCVDAFFVPEGTPEVPEGLLKMEQHNDMCKIMNALFAMYIDMVARMRECGTFECGEVNTN